MIDRSLSIAVAAGAPAIVPQQARRCRALTSTRRLVQQAGTRSSYDRRTGDLAGAFTEVDTRRRRLGRCSLRARRGGHQGYGTIA